eukprot:Seg1666.17 transcript_id=Seg1666.17/GoldUCD/mRNA.D3Y31 product="Endonuclease III-like protein 1" protein_id=Seg1666.17/GoldUCD/D3Y31
MASPYFNTRTTRNAAAKALAALGSVGRTTSQRVEPKRNFTKTEPMKIEYEEAAKFKEEKFEADEKISNSKISPSKRKGKSPNNTRIKKEKIDESWEPENWKKLLKNIKIMRQEEDAPVDSQGCERTADPDETPETIRYHILVSLMLSAQTKDQVTFAAMERLKNYGLNIDHVLKTDEKKIGELIYPVGFWKRKATFIKQATEICKEQYKGDIPETLEGLLALPGVGPKMAHICMHAAWNVMTGIGVDTHVHRISNRLGWVKKPTKTPEDTRKALEAWLPREEWETINVLLVGFGQQSCLPVGPKCGTCLNNKICPYGRSAMSGRKPKKNE